MLVIVTWPVRLCWVSFCVCSYSCVFGIFFRTSVVVSLVVSTSATASLERFFSAMSRALRQTLYTMLKFQPFRLPVFVGSRIRFDEFRDRTTKSAHIVLQITSPDNNYVYIIMYS